MNSESKAIRSVRLFRTAPHDCSYLPSQEASTLFLDPDVSISASINTQLSDRGFRRSGSHIYRPDCATCSSCLSSRVLVNDFVFKRQHRKILNRNQDLLIQETESLDSDTAYSLYCEYIHNRHADGDMHPPNPEQYAAFIAMKPEGTRFFEFSLQERLLAFSVIDQLKHGLSAVYTFYDAEQSRRSLGHYVILWQILKAKELRLPYLYLGYWIKDCPKMNYKINYRPLEMFVRGNWVRLN